MPLYRGKTSEVWNHFMSLEGDKAKCGYCSAQLSFSGGNISNLKRHLTSKHPTVPLNRNNKNILDQTSINDQLDEIQPDTSTSTVNQIVRPHGIGTSGINMGHNINSMTSSLVLPRQRAVTDFFECKRPMTTTKKKQLDEQLTKMIVKGYYPFSLVEDSEFKVFLQMLNSNYTVPSRNTISNSILPRLYETAQNQLKGLIDKANAVCLTTDCWTSINNTSFMAITGHFIDENMVYRSVCIEFREFSERHTTSNISSKLQDIVQHWNISHKIPVIVSDNAANIVAGIRESGFRHLPCFAHSLNLAVQKGLKYIEPVTQKVKAIVEYFKRSHHALIKLHSVQTQMGLPVIKLIQDVITRWNSTYDMLNRFTDAKDAIITTLALLQPDNISMLTPIEWQVVEKSTEVLKIFYEVTKAISGDQYVTLSSILIFIGAMTQTLEQFKSDNTLPPMVLEMVKAIKEQIISRLKPLEDNELVTQATLLDPRFKKLGFCNTSENKLNIALDQLKRKVCTISIPNNTLIAHENITTTQETANSSSSLLWQSFDKNFNSQRASQNPQAAGIIELDKYFNEPMIDRHENPLTWWNERKSVYPRLFQLVLRRLCITATSVPCERLFSKAGNVITDRRYRIKSKKASQVLFLSQNL